MSDYEVVGLERFHSQINNNSEANYKHVFCTVDIVNSDTIRHSKVHNYMQQEIQSDKYNKYKYMYMYEHYSVLFLIKYVKVLYVITSFYNLYEDKCLRITLHTMVRLIHH